MKKVLKTSPVFVFLYFEDVNQATRPLWALAWANLSATESL